MLKNLKFEGNNEIEQHSASPSSARKRISKREMIRSVAAEPALGSANEKRHS
jgi:hypothetical protein